MIIFQRCKTCVNINLVCELERLANSLKFSNYFEVNFLEDGLGVF